MMRKTMPRKMSSSDTPEMIDSASTGSMAPTGLVPVTR
jgi:hypothetical protein